MAETKERLCYYLTAAAIALLLCVIFALWHRHTVERPPGTNKMIPGYHKRVPDNPQNPQRYEYNDFLARAAGGPRRGTRCAHKGAPGEP